MAVTSVDTESVRQICNDINDIVTEYEVEITKLFKRFSEVPYVTKEWVGNKSEEYFNHILLEKADYMTFGEEIKKYKRKIKDDMDNIEDTISTNSKNESGEIYND